MLSVPSAHFAPLYKRDFTMEVVESCPPGLYVGTKLRGEISQAVAWMAGRMTGLGWLEAVG